MLYLENYKTTFFFFISKSMYKCFIDNRIRALQNSHNLKHFRYGIDANLLNTQIASMHNHFVITIVDKASNIEFKCKKRKKIVL